MSHDLLTGVLVAAAAICGVAHLFGGLCRRLGIPSVVGEIAAGIALGPSLLGQLAPSALDWLLPAANVPVLSVLGQFGIVCLMFGAGLEIDRKLLARDGRAAVVVSLASIMVPLTLGFGLGAFLAESFAPAGGGWLTHGSFLAVAIAVTAFPVLVRLLQDMGLASTRIGRLALACAAVDDLVAWCLLALLTAMARAAGGDAWTTIAGAGVFVLVLALIVKPSLERFARRDGRVPDLLIVCGLLVAAAATDAIGLHAMFGAFAFGLAMPRGAPPAIASSGVVHLLLVPLFFAASGLNVRLDLMFGSATDLLICGAVLIIATAGKVGGVLLTRHLAGLSLREATALGFLVNARGLVELVVLNIGLSHGFISPRLFTIMVVMAIVTTASAGPLAKLFLPRAATAKDKMRAAQPPLVEAVARQ